MGSAGDVGVMYDKSCSACAAEDLLMCVEQHVSSFLISGTRLFLYACVCSYMDFVSLFGWVFFLLVVVRFCACGGYSNVLLPWCLLKSTHKHVT